LFLSRHLRASGLSHAHPATFFSSFLFFFLAGTAGRRGAGVDILPPSSTALSCLPSFLLERRTGEFPFWDFGILGHLLLA
jgi:hypothetical protein